ncbi:MAG: agmatine deiminase [Planctomycetota bacterium]|jgi:agmatine deiminase
MNHLCNSQIGRLLTMSLGLLGLVVPTLGQSQVAVAPSEDGHHEGTWLQWPHRFTYGLLYQQDLDPTWVSMTSALVQSEDVHIIAYSAQEESRIRGLLNQAGVPLANVNFLIHKTDDCWVRDNGPIFVYGADGQLKISDWGFNGWGFDTPYQKDDPVPVSVAASLGVPRVDKSVVVLEGGAIEMDGSGVLMATRSSILEPNRNPGWTQAQMEVELAETLGIYKFIWLDGQAGGQLDITDTHIDGFARFSRKTIVTMSGPDLSYWGLSNADIQTLQGATDLTGEPYAFVELPLTVNNVVTTYGQNQNFKGSYVNFYTANTVVLVPTYADPNDSIAMGILQQHYPGRTVIGIDVRNLYASGGMVHCVTQQQPERLDCQGQCVNAFCVSTSNSSGVAAQIDAVGEFGISDENFTLVASGVIPNSFGLFFYGANEGQTPFGAGWLCLSGSVARLNPALVGSASGVVAHSVDFQNGSAGVGPNQITAGSTWKFQYWYRDGIGWNLTDGLSVTFSN